jgi:hypothetical protein
MNTAERRQERSGVCGKWGPGTTSFYRHFFVFLFHSFQLNEIMIYYLIGCEWDWIIGSVLIKLSSLNCLHETQIWKLRCNTTLKRNQGKMTITTVIHLSNSSVSHKDFIWLLPSHLNVNFVPKLKTRCRSPPPKNGYQCSLLLSLLNMFWQLWGKWCRLHLMDLKLQG